MKNILETMPAIENLLQIFPKKRLTSKEEIVGTAEWPHLLELFELTNEIRGYKFVKTRNFASPIPVCINGYDENFSLPNLQKSPILFEDNFCHHRLFNGTNFYSEVDEISKKLEIHNDYEKAMREALVLCKSIIKRKKDWCLVSGPMSSGGFKKENREVDVEKNMRWFNKTIVTASRKYRVFNQMPLENLFSMMYSTGGCNSSFFIKNFYKPMLQTGNFNLLLQMHNWYTSNGAKEESAIADELGIPKSIIDFEVFLPTVLKRTVTDFEYQDEEL